MDRRMFLRGVSLSALVSVAPGLTQSAVAAVSGLASGPWPKGPGETLSLDLDWRFHLGDLPFPKIKGHGASYTSAKAGAALGAAASDFDDSDWRVLDLPHDWVVEGPFDPNENVSQGYRPRGKAWYRRTLRLDPSDRGKHLELQFDGVATHATIWFNGNLVARNWSGYNSIYIDITPFACYGDEQNSVVVRVDADPMEGWWYEGGGIYRHVWLVKRAAVHIATDGVHADPRQVEGRWTVPIEVTLGNMGGQAAAVDVACALLGPDGQVQVESQVQAIAAATGEGQARLTLRVDDPRPWSIDSPVLYSVRTRVIQEGAILDEAVTVIGFRTLRFDPDHGFLLNGQKLKIKGVCLHQDHAGVGVAVPDALWEFRLRRIKAMGANAIRCSHNAPASQMLDVADRLGLLILDENRNFNPSKDYLEQLQWLVRRDRNHPSVILWSVFNEEPMQGTEAGYQMVRRMVAAVKALDDGRPVTAAMNGGMFAPINVSQAVDVVGFNYQIESYDRFHAAHPTLPMISSEDASAFETRGVFATDKARNVLTSFDDEAAPWGASHRQSWKAIDERPFIAGGFAWTGFDYRGEPTPFEWPSAGSSFGILDLCGFPKGAYWFRQAMWIKDRPVLKILPHWNWPGREGQAIRVMAVTNAERVRLLLNGKLISEQTVDPYDMASWKVPYAAGRLEAIAYRAGRQIARDVVETTGAAVALRLTSDRSFLAGDGRDAAPITVAAIDAAGRVVPTAMAQVRFEITGGRIIGLGNGDPNDHDPEKGDVRRLFNGLAQVIVQTDWASSGKLRLKAAAPSLRPTETTVTVLAVPPAPLVPPTAPIALLGDWRRSPILAARPDPGMTIADNDMNSWAFVRPGALEVANGDGWILFRARVTPRAAVRARGGRLVLTQLVGAAEVWQDGALLARKTDPAEGSLMVALPPGQGERQFSVLLACRGGQASGLGGVVLIEENRAQRCGRRAAALAQ